MNDKQKDALDERQASRHRLERRRRRIRRAMRELDPGRSSGVGAVFAPVVLEAPESEPFTTPHKHSGSP